MSGSQAACTAADRLAEAVQDGFPQHPDAGLLLSFPGSVSSSQPGDDPSRFADAPGLEVYAGSSPITRASGKKPRITRRG